jgi:hypothetical protein
MSVPRANPFFVTNAKVSHDEHKAWLNNLKDMDLSKFKANLATLRQKLDSLKAYSGNQADKNETCKLIASVLEATSDRNHPNRFKKAAPQAAQEGWSQTNENWAGGDELRTTDGRRR